MKLTLRLDGLYRWTLENKWGDSRFCADDDPEIALIYDSRGYVILATSPDKLRWGTYWIRFHDDPQILR